MSIQDNIIKSISFSNDEILSNIIQLYKIDGIELDVCYSKGNFYKSGLIKQPKYKFDLNSILKNVPIANCKYLRIPNNIINSMIFDPPFLVGLPKKGTETTSKMNQRFTAFFSIKELWQFYDNSLIEFSRILKKNGLLIIKCQDTVSGGKNYFSSVYFINKLQEYNYLVEDLFVLLATKRIIGKFHRIQQHARKYHSYYIVARKK